MGEGRGQTARLRLSMKSFGVHAEYEVQPLTHQKCRGDKHQVCLLRHLPAVPLCNPRGLLGKIEITPRSPGDCGD